MASARFFRYLAPNLITLSSMIFGLVSLWSAHRGDAPLAAWMIIYAVLTDRLDGLVARAVKGTSELGMQLDSFADFLNFGVAPAYLVLVYLSGHPDLPYKDGGTEHTLLFAACGAYMLCAVFRLARYNVLSDDQIPTKIFFGFPTTLSGGLLAIWILVLLKYDPRPELFGGAFGGAKLLGDSFVTPLWVWKYMPIGVVVMGYLMASRLPMPKVGMTKNKVVSVLLLSLVVTGYVCGFAMKYPEICVGMPTIWSVMFLFWGQASPTWRAMYPPPLFPKKEPARPMVRPQADIEDIVLDESSLAGEPAATKPEV
ncbi:MAG: CDP-alcohol phosphatidyltransferase family protein [Deltaproteobacteria bacterium]|nr:CDP-alcohol phosphatidyltransferase family protein [Deltaproteobacteria bacterium]MDQ3299658.1 CDP-alcohol phosphatidyltransferase family protein [Myxococcota bacterium]